MKEGRSIPGLCTALIVALLVLASGRPMYGPNVTATAPILFGDAPAVNLPSRDVNVSSLTGTDEVSDLAFTKFIGDGTPVNNGGLGTFVGSIDIDGDGKDELAISAPHITAEGGEPDAGILYILNGNVRTTNGSIDLQDTLLNITVRGNSQYSQILESITVGDLDDDGHRDLVLGCPSWPDPGKVYVLWGEETGFPSDIDLVKLAGNSPNGNPIGFLRTSSYAVISGYVGTSVLGTRLGQNVMTRDLDGDGFDDLVFSFHGWTSVFIVWGGPDRMAFGSSYTYLKNDMVVSQFGYRCDIGDMDGDGKYDLIVSAPSSNDETKGLSQVGAVHIVFDVGRIKGNSSLQIGDVARPNIYGSDPYDLFGMTVKLLDLNNDGKDDLIVGVPGDDGPNDNRYDAGQLMLFYGAEIVNFPTYMVGLDRCDKVIYGAQGEIGPLEPDNLGANVRIGDLDSDGKEELVVGLPGRDGNGTSDAGNVVIYPFQSSLGASGGTADLAKVTPRAVIVGDDPYDGLGYSMAIPDLNGDGAGDLVLGAPGADGPDNTRPGAGEAYLLLGTNIVIGSLMVYGEAANGVRIYAGAGNATLDIGFQLYSGGSGDVNTNVVIDPAGLGIVLSYEAGFFSEEWDTFDLLELLPSLSTLVKTPTGGNLKFTFSVDWFYYLSDSPEVHVYMGEGNDRWTTRIFNNPFQVVRDVAISVEPTVLRNGHGLPTGHEWFSMSDAFSLTDIGLDYSDGTGRTFPGARIWAVLSREGAEVSSRRADRTWTVEDTVPGTTFVNYTVSLVPGEDEVPPGFPVARFPKMGAPYALTLKVDDSPPIKPTPISIEPDRGRSSIYDDDTGMEISWTVDLSDLETLGGTGGLSEMDRNGSGVRRFNVQVNAGASMPTMDDGGLLGTYFRDGNFSDNGGTRLDQVIDFDEDVWGMWGPEPLKIPPYGFSVRWDGWLRFPKDRYYSIEVAGIGVAKVILGGATILDWSDLSANPNTGPRFHTQDEVLPIEVYFRQSGPSSSFFLLMDDDRGEFVPIPGSYLYHTANRTAIVLPGEGAHNVRVTAVDWSGLSSGENDITVIVESDGPGIDLTEFRTWYGSSDPTISLVVLDPESFGLPGSGVDASSVEYRIRRTADLNYGEWMSKGRRVYVLEDGPELPARVRTTFDPELTSDWEGQVQFRARDGAGNEELSSSMFLGIDMVPPTFEVVSPNLGSPLMSTGFDLILRTYDGKGSGVVGSTVGLRIREKAASDWGPWEFLTDNETGRELISPFNIRLPSGSYIVQFQAKDIVGNMGLSSGYDFTIEDPKVDLPPVPVIKAPVEGTQFRIGFPVPLDATGTKDDGVGRYGKLVITWFSNISGYLGSGQNITTYKLTLGHHRISLYADDGTPGHNMSASVNISIVRPNETKPPIDDDDGDDKEELLWLLFGSLIVALLLASLIFFLMLRYRRRREEEIRLDYAQRTDDDLDYDRRSEEEERALGMKAEPVRLSEDELKDERIRLYGEE